MPKVIPHRINATAQSRSQGADLIRAIRKNGSVFLPGKMQLLA